MSDCDHFFLPKYTTERAGGEFVEEAYCAKCLKVVSV